MHYSCICTYAGISFDVQTMNTMEGDGSTSVCLQLTAPILLREETIDVATTGLGSAIGMYV